MFWALLTVGLKAKLFNMSIAILCVAARLSHWMFSEYLKAIPERRLYGAWLLLHHIADEVGLTQEAEPKLHEVIDKALGIKEIITKSKVRNG